MPNLVQKTLATLGKQPDPADKEDPIPSGTTNLAIVTTLVAGIGLIAQSITGWFTIFLGDKPTPTTQASFSIAVIAALTVVLAADVLGRAYASAGQRGNSTTDTVADEQTSEEQGLSNRATVSIPSLDASNETGWQVLKTTGEKILVVKKGEPPAWYALSETRGE